MGNRMHVEYYDSVADLFERNHVKPKGLRDNADDTWENTAKPEGDTFHGCHAQLYNKFKNHNVKQEAGIMSGIVDNINCADFVERAWEYKQRLEEGDMIDVNRYLDGHEKFWNGVRRVYKNKQVVRVYIGIGGDCNRTKEELAICGAVGVTVTEVLESMGIGVELWGACFSTGLFKNNDNGGICVKLKDSNEFADLGMINFVSGNAHVFRNIFFRSWVNLAHRDGYDVWSNLGTCRSLTAEDIGLDESEQDSAIIIPQFYNVESAKQWLIDMFNGLKSKMDGKERKDEQEL